MPGNANSGGHNRKTLSRLSQAGTYRDDRHSGFGNMRHVHGRPDTPDDLKGVALAEWGRMVNRLEQAGSLSKIDDAAIYQYAKLFAETTEAEHHMMSSRRMVDKLVVLTNKLDGDSLVNAMREITNLERVLSNYVATVRQGRMAIRQYLVEFGMTSSSRGRVRLPQGSDKPTGKLALFRGGKDTA